MKTKKTPLRVRLEKKLISQTDTPFIIFIILFAAIYGATLIARYDEDLSQNLVSELIGATFIILVVNILLVRSKNKRWKMVNNKVDYMIARSIYRLRDGIASRGFRFSPNLADKMNAEESIQEMRAQREQFLQELEVIDIEALGEKLNKEFFTEENLQYFTGKSRDVWEIVNMKYSEYLAPDLIQLLMNLNIELNDLCAHIRIHLKRSSKELNLKTYKSIGRNGALTNLHNIIAITAELKEEGYSQLADVKVLDFSNY